jgi:hypothetical protein
MKFIFNFIILTVITSVIALGYFGFIPAISNLFGSNKPRDLGVKYTSADYTTTHEKFGVEVGTIPESSFTNVKESLQYSGKKEVVTTLSSAEITAYANAETWKFAPISNLQVKINPDGTGEVSGVLNIENVLSYVSLVTPIEEVKKAINQFNISSNPPFYTKGSVTVVNNKVDFNIQSLEVGRIPVPQNYVSENTGALNSFVTDRLNSIPNLQVRSLTLNNGQVNFDATTPDKVLKVNK